MKKVFTLSILAIFCMNFTFFVHADSEYNMVNLLVSIGIITEEDDFSEEGVLTRAEAAAILTRLLAAEGNSSEGVLYTDVPSSHWAAEAISVMTMRGIISGYGNRTFEPEREVQFQELVKMLVSILGYGQRAAYSGGYPSGYVLTASEIGLLNSVSNLTGTAVTRKVAAQLIYNSLHIPLMTLTGATEQSEIVSIDRDVTLLNKYHNVYRVDGVLQADAYATAFENVDITSQTDLVMLEDVKYFTEIELTDLLGYRLEVYYRYIQSENRMVIIYASPKRSSNRVVKVLGDQLSENTTSSQIVYLDERDLVRTIVIPQSADIVFNNRFYTKAAHLATDVITPLIDEVTAIDNNNDGVYDVVLIKQYDTFVVEAVKPLDGYIYTRFGKGMLDLQDRSDYRVIKDGQDSALANMKKWDVLSVLTDKIGEIREIIISSNSVTGEVSENFRDGEGEFYVIKGIPYKLSPHYDVNQNKKLKTGIKLTAYIDVFDRIAATDSTYNTSLFYGYIMANDTPDGIEALYRLKIFNSDDEFVECNLAKNVEIDGRLYKPAIDRDRITAALRENGVSENGGNLRSGVCQIIAYEVNSQSEITKIDTQTPNVIEDQDDLRKDYALITGEGSDVRTAWRRYLKNGRAFVLAKKDTGFMIDDMTVAFIVPAMDKTNEKLYALVPFDYFVNEEYYNLEAYNVNPETNMATVIVNEDKIAATGQIAADTTPLMLVDKVTQAVEDGEQLYKIYGWSNGEYQSVYADGETEGEIWDYRKPTNTQPATLPISIVDGGVNVNTGDLIVFVKNAQNKTKRIIKWLPSDLENLDDGLNLDTEKMFAFEIGTYNDKIFGNVVKCNDKVITLSIGSFVDGKPEYFNYNVETFKPFVYKYDASRNKTDLASLSDVTAGQKAFVRVRFGEIKDVIIYDGLREVSSVED